MRMRLRRSRDSASVDGQTVTDDSTEEKQLRTVSFVVHAARGMIRDPNTRRKTMFILLVAALVLLFCGSTVLQSTLNPHEHPGWFILFWLVCAWLTLTALLLAIFDMLMVRLQARKDSPRSGE
jgi:protein-S-isoprenylcysteine O-methyltransferase Ste14